MTGYVIFDLLSIVTYDIHKLHLVQRRGFDKCTSAQ